MSHSKSTIPFLEAQAWQRENAEAKAEFLDFAKDYIGKNKAEFGKNKALKRFLSAFKRGLLGGDLKNRLRKKAVSKTTYYRWLAAFEKANLSGLIEHYNNGGSRIPSQMREEIEKIVWENHLCRHKDVLDDLGVVFGQKNISSYSTVRRFVEAYKKEHWPELVLKHEGQKGLRDRNMLPAIGQMDGNITRPNQRWELDTTIGDLFAKSETGCGLFVMKDGRRCKLVGVIDVFSRNVKYFFTERETALAVGEIIRLMIILWGLPEEIVIDNGKPFKNRRILNFLRALGISIHICLPGNPTEKPFIERSFGVLTDGLFRRLCGYSGNSIQNRPGEIEIKYSLHEAQQLVNDFVENVYTENVHRATRQRPRERMAPPDFLPKTVNPRELDILLMEEHERTVSQGCIRYLGGKYFHPLLPEAQKIKFRASDFDAGEIIVFHGRKFLCIAEDYVRKGKTPQEIIEAKKERSRELRTRVKAHEALQNNHQEKDYRIRARIEKGKQDKPAELPKKADVLSFPSLQNIPLTAPTPIEAMSEMQFDEPAAEPKRRLILTRQERYLNIMSRKQRGEILDEQDIEWLGEFMQSNEFRLIGERLNQKLKAGVNA
jgi:putative transposase